MHNLNKPFFLLLFLISLASCKKEQHIGYGVETANVYEDKSRKTKKKNDAEYISILYTNLYQTAISPNQLYKTQNVLYSIGDQDVASEMLLSNYFNTSFQKIVWSGQYQPCRASTKKAAEQSGELF